MQKVISWDEYFMGVAALSALRSKDPKRQVGACIINTDKRIVGIGYNGMPRGLADSADVWAEDTKLLYVVHAEANAILNSTVSLKDATLYVTKFPCNECAKLIIQSGIKEVVYQGKLPRAEYHPDTVIMLFKAAGVMLRQTPTELNMSITNI